MSNVIEQLLLPSDIKRLHLTIASIISNLFNNFYTICRGKQDTKIKQSTGEQAKTLFLYRKT